MIGFLTNITVNTDNELTTDKINTHKAQRICASINKRLKINITTNMAKLVKLRNVFVS